MSAFFITGTDTGVGKTELAVRLLRMLRRGGVRAAGFKPICCGDRADAELLLKESADGLTIDEVNPFWFHRPLAPLVAAKLEKREFADADAVYDGYRRLAERHELVLVEGVGGWMVPLAPGVFVADLAAKLEVPVLLVVANRLGCLNHTVLTLRSIAAARCTCPAVVLNQNRGQVDAAAIATNRDALGEVTTLPVLEMPAGDRQGLDPVWARLFGL